MASPFPPPFVAGLGGGRPSEKKLSLLQILTTLKIKTSTKPYDPEMLLDHDNHGVYCKNLVLKDRKGTYYLVIIPINQKIDLKQFKNFVSAYRNVSFACEQDVQKMLGCDQGSVNPFGVMFNQNPSKLRIILDAPLTRNPFNLYLYFHPFVPHEAMSISYKNLKKFVENFEHHIEPMNLFEICNSDERYLCSVTLAEAPNSEIPVNDASDRSSLLFYEIIDSLHMCTIL